MSIAIIVDVFSPARSKLVTPDAESVISTLMISTGGTKKAPKDKIRPADSLPTPSREDIIKRRLKVDDLVKVQKSIDQIADILGVPKSTVVNDRFAMRATRASARQGAPLSGTAYERRRQVHLALQTKQYFQSKLALRFGVSTKTISNDRFLIQANPQSYPLPDAGEK